MVFLSDHRVTDEKCSLRHGYGIHNRGWCCLSTFKSFVCDEQKNGSAVWVILRFTIIPTFRSTFLKVSGIICSQNKPAQF